MCQADGPGRVDLGLVGDSVARSLGAGRRYAARSVAGAQPFLSCVCGVLVYAKKLKIGNLKKKMMGKN